jgi:hypothetical protein
MTHSVRDEKWSEHFFTPTKSWTFSQTELLPCVSSVRAPVPKGSLRDLPFVRRRRSLPDAMLVDLHDSNLQVEVQLYELIRFDSEFVVSD